MDGGEVKPEASTTDAPPSGTVEEHPGEGEAQHVPSDADQQSAVENTDKDDVLEGKPPEQSDEASRPAEGATTSEGEGDSKESDTTEQSQENEQQPPPAAEATVETAAESAQETQEESTTPQEEDKQSSTPHDDGNEAVDKPQEELLQDAKPGQAESEEPKETDSRPVTEQSKSSSQSEREKEKERKKEKKQKRKSREGSRAGSTAPKLRKRSTKSESRSRQSVQRNPSNSKHLEAILLSAFHPFDPDNTGYMDASVFWEVVVSAEMNLQLTEEEVVALKELIQPDISGQIAYGEFATHAADIVSSLYQNQAASDSHWVDLRTSDGTIVISYNKQTGEFKDMADDLFAGMIQEMFQAADADGKGYVNKEEFTQMLQSQQMLEYLTDEDIAQLQQYFEGIPDEKASYTEFYPLAKELILKVYRVKDPSESEWCQLTSPIVGVFWFNKYTGETKRDLQITERQQEIAFLNKTYAELEAVNFELEQYKAENRELQNEVAQASEEQEALATQLYETGHALDQANTEIQRQEEETAEMRAIMAAKDQETEQLRREFSEIAKLKETLSHREQELINARDTIEIRDESITQRDRGMSELQRQMDAITDRLKNASGVVDAKDSTISTQQRQLVTAQERAKEYERQLPELASNKLALQDELQTTKQTLEEKNSTLGQARKQLKSTRDRNMEMERELEKLSQTQEKLRNSESEIRTLKSFLTTKTAMVEKRKKELRDTRVKMAELEEKDGRRAVILADVLEKTARQYQQQVAGMPSGTVKGVSFGVPITHHATAPSMLLSELRPASAPAIPPDGESEAAPQMYDLSPPPRVIKTFTLQKTTPTTAPSLGQGTGRQASKKGRVRSRTVPKLPPIRPAAQRKSFVFTTSNDVRQQQKAKDYTLMEHAASNPQCSCELCKTNASSLQSEAGLAFTQTGGVPVYCNEGDPREVALAGQLHTGVRVLIKMKQSEFDLEPQTLTGIVKYVGKIDSEFIDNRIYVGVKLDEPVGDTDGVVKTKRYFTCPPKHGKVVRITNVIAVLPNKSVFYKSLQEISKRSPYTNPQKKTSSIKVS